MNFTLFKMDIKANKIIFLIVISILTMYLFLVISMYDPDNMKKLEEMMSLFPEEIINAFGFKNISGGLNGTIVSYIYGFLIFLLPMIFVFNVNNKLIAKQVDQGSMAYILATPNSRQKIAITQALFSLISIITIFIFVTLIAIFFAMIINPGEMNIGQFIALNLYTIAFYITISGISYFASCLFSDTSNSLGFGSGIPIAFFILQMLVNLSEKLDWIKYFTLFTLYNPERLISGDTSFVIISSIIFIILGFGLYISGILIFKKRDLSL